MPTFIVLHLSQTDIRCDSRILKELSSLAKRSEYEVYGIGVASDEASHINNQEQNFTIITIHLITDVLKMFPRPIRYAFALTELTVRLIMKGVRLRPKVVHCHDTMALPGATLVKLITGAKLVYDAHELESDKGGQTPSLSKATIIIERFCWSSVDHLITVSSSILKWYQSNLGSKASSLILNSPLIEANIDYLNAQDEYEVNYFQTLYNIPNDCLVFIYVGLLVDGRGIETVLSAFRSDKITSHLVFVGYGKMWDDIEAIAAKYENVHLHDPVPHEKVVALVRNADVGLCLIEKVSLSDYYCLPNKLFEYSFAGLPVLASRFPDIENIVKKYNLGYCCDNDTRSIIRAIEEFEQDRPGRIVADLTPLSWETQEQVLANVYRTVLGVKG